MSAYFYQKHIMAPADFQWGQNFIYTTAALIVPDAEQFKTSFLEACMVRCTFYRLSMLYSIYIHAYICTHIYYCVCMIYMCYCVCVICYSVFMTYYSTCIVYFVYVHTVCYCLCDVCITLYFWICINVYEVYYMHLFRNTQHLKSQYFKTLCLELSLTHTCIIYIRLYVWLL